MTTARDYLVAKGLAKPGRGKFSNAAKAELTRAMGSGTKFSDWPKAGTGPITSKSTGPVKSATPATTAPGDTPYLSPSDFRYPESEYIVKGSNGKKYSVRECCNTCKVSITNHACDAPTIYGNISVTVERR